MLSETPPPLAEVKPSLCQQICCELFSLRIVDFGGVSKKDRLLRVN